MLKIMNKVIGIENGRCSAFPYKPYTSISICLNLPSKKPVGRLVCIPFSVQLVHKIYTFHHPFLTSSKWLFSLFYFFFFLSSFCCYFSLSSKFLLGFLCFHGGDDDDDDNDDDDYYYY